MIFLGKLTKINTYKMEIGFIHYQPFDSENGLGKTQEQLNQEGILIDEMPQPIDNGKIPLMYYNPMTKTIFYEYIDKPKTQEDIYKELQAQNAQILLALVNGGLM